MPTGADRLVQALYHHGVRCLFGMPGSHSTHLYDALQRHGGIETFLCRNEQAGAFMADGYARATGRVPTKFPINHDDPLAFEVKSFVPPVPASPTTGLNFTF